MDTIITNTDVKLLSEIKRLLLSCDEFYFTTAFITLGGISQLKYELKILEDNNVKGSIITSDYLMFTEPRALRLLDNYKNIELRFYMLDNFHAKGYYFKIKNKWVFVIGSSNLTANAMTVNRELNIMKTYGEDSRMVKQIKKDFQLLKNNSCYVWEIIDQYEEKYELNKSSTKIENTSLNGCVPNEMQQVACEQLQKDRDLGKNKSLLISATGTGKTYLSAFDVKKVNPSKLLFVVHRWNIAAKALASFQSVIFNKKMILYKGGNIDENVDYIFTTIQTLSLDKNLSLFSFDNFDYIIIDEVHHAGAKTYLKVINYFKCRFLLGMTATPERMDGFNIFELFDYNVSYELRLNEALKLDLLVPFHYFGIADIKIDDKLKTREVFKHLVSQDRVNHIINASNYYGHYETICHCLMFVSSIEEGEKISLLLNEMGYMAICLSSRDSEERRSKIIRDFEYGIYNYLITVDIFNEGIDIPKVNQVILLRPTKSATIYIQQIGRGLRKYKDQEYVVILDFIGNYETNFLIPIALSGNNDYEIDSLNKFVLNANELISGSSTISFDIISQKRLLKNINSVNMSKMMYIKQDYLKLKNRINKVPVLSDFNKYNYISPNVILKTFDTYFDLVVKFESENKLLTSSEYNLLLYVSKVLLHSNRIHEVYIIKLLMENNYSINELNDKIEKTFGLDNQLKTTKNAIDHLMRDTYNSFSEHKKFGEMINVKVDKYELISTKNNYLVDIIYMIIKRLIKSDSITNDLLIIHKLYKKQDAFRHLNLNYTNAFQVSGYTCDEEQKLCLMFITFESNNYTNTLYDNKTFNWFSKNNRVLTRDKVVTLEGNICSLVYEIHVFARVNSSTKYYYLGVVDEVVDVICHNNHIEAKFRLKNEIIRDIYNVMSYKESEIDE